MLDLGLTRQSSILSPALDMFETPYRRDTDAPRAAAVAGKTSDWDQGLSALTDEFMR